MTHHNQLPHRQINESLLVKCILTGAGIALLVISFFVFGADHQNAAWGKFWQIRPLIVTPLAGAIGGAIFYLLQYFSAWQGFSKAPAIILGVIIYLVGLWLGIVLGLAGTMWN